MGKYDFNLSDPASWTKMPRPVVDGSFIKQMNEIGGKKSGQDRFRLIWGMDEEIYVDNEGSRLFPSGWYLKYQLCTTEPKLVGYEWKDEKTGKTQFVPDIKQIPAFVKHALPRFKSEMVGTPRFCIEMWRDEGEENGLFDRAGYYHFRWIVEDAEATDEQTCLKPFRTPDNRDLEILKGYMQLAAKLTQEDIESGVARDREKEAAHYESARDERRAEMSESFLKFAKDAPQIHLPQQIKNKIPDFLKSVEKDMTAAVAKK